MPVNIQEKFKDMLVKENVVLSGYSTLKIGGVAKYFIEVETGEDLQKAVKTARRSNIPYVILGGGTNTLFCTDIYEGIVIRNKTSKIKLIGFRGSYSKNTSNIKDVYLEVESGVLINRLVRYTLDEELGGLENFFHQPGTVGGAMYMNAHNMWKSDFFGDHVYEATILGSDGEVKKVNQKYFDFGYDKSIIQNTKDIVLSVIVNLEKGQKETLWERAQEVAEYRKRTQPQGVQSMGCTFRNISKEEAFRIHTPEYTTSAGYLIEQAGLKGKKIGGVRISDKHANFIVNESSGTTKDMLQLIALVKAKVKEKFNVELQEEVLLV